jgi:hypothetical protein
MLQVHLRHRQIRSPASTHSSFERRSPLSLELRLDPLEPTVHSTGRPITVRHLSSEAQDGHSISPLLVLGTILLTEISNEWMQRTSHVVSGGTVACDIGSIFNSNAI